MGKRVAERLSMHENGASSSTLQTALILSPLLPPSFDLADLQRGHKFSLPMLTIESPAAVIGLFITTLLVHLYGKRWSASALRYALVSRDKREKFAARRAEIAEMKQNLIKLYSPSTFDKYALEKRKLNKAVAEQATLGSFSLSVRCDSRAALAPCHFCFLHNSCLSPRFSTSGGNRTRGKSAHAVVRRCETWPQVVLHRWCTGPLL